MALLDLFLRKAVRYRAVCKKILLYLSKRFLKRLQSQKRLIAGLIADGIIHSFSYSQLIKQGESRICLHLFCRSFLEVDSELSAQASALQAQLNELQEKRKGIQTVIDMFESKGGSELAEIAAVTVPVVLATKPAVKTAPKKRQLPQNQPKEVKSHPRQPTKGQNSQSAQGWEQLPRSKASPGASC